MLAKLQQVLDAHHVPYTPLVHRSAYTAQELAAAEHVPGREHAKVAIVKAGKRFVMVVLPAPRKIDFRELAAILPEKEARLASEDEFAGLFPGCEPGAMPPFGDLFAMEVIADRSLEQDEDIVFQAGSHNESIRMKYADFKRLVRPRVVDLAG